MTETAMTETALLIQQIRDPNNWTDDLFEKVDSFRVEHGDGDNILRRSLSPEIWRKFDMEYCERKDPGQAIQVGNEILSNTGGQAALFQTEQEKNSSIEKNF